MSTNVLECPDKASLVTLLYAEELDSEERRRVEGHVLVCEGCAAELNELRGVRGALAEWETPPMPLGLRVVREPVVRARRWWIAAPLAAAATLVLAAAVALANLEVHVGPEGVTVRTGWGDAATPGDPASAELGDAPVAAVQEARDDAPWRAELAAFREEVQRALEAGPVVATSTAPDAPSSDEVMRRVRTLIARSESQQQEQLAEQLSDLVMQLQLQRHEDLARVSQEIGQIKARQGFDQRMLNDFVRVVSAQQP